jgi:hypothetical protein
MPSHAVTLIASIVAMTALVIVLSASASSDNREHRSFDFFLFLPDREVPGDRSDRGWHNCHAGHRRGGLRGRKSAAGSAQKGEDGELGFFEAVTSFVFGDGDPNEGFEQARWAAVAERIQELGGVVSAEEMRPFLDVEQDASKGSTSDADASSEVWPSCV